MPAVFPKRKEHVLGDTNNNPANTYKNVCCCVGRTASGCRRPNFQLSHDHDAAHLEDKQAEWLHKCVTRVMSMAMYTPGHEYAMPQPEARSTAAARAAVGRGGFDVPPMTDALGNSQKGAPGPGTPPPGTRSPSQYWGGAVPCCLWCTAVPKPDEPAPSKVGHYSYAGHSQLLG